MPSGASKDSLKEYVKSIAAPGTNTANIFGLKSWMSSSRGETAAPLLENEDNFQEPSGSAGDSSWLGSSTTNFLGLVSERINFLFAMNMHHFSQKSVCCRLGIP